MSASNYALRMVLHHARGRESGMRLAREFTHPGVRRDAVQYARECNWSLVRLLRRAHGVRV